MATAKLFTNGGSQAVRLPAEFRFDGDEVIIIRDPETGDVILRAANQNQWENFFSSYDPSDVPDDFLSDRDQDDIERDIF